MNPKHTAASLTIGQRHTAEIEIGDDMVRAFADATRDHNPLHLDDEFARTTPFGRRIAHGMLIAGILSGVLGMEFPGQGTVYASQTLKFIRPVFLGDLVTVSIEVVEIDPERNRVRLATTCSTAAGKVLVGEAVVLPPR